MGMRRTLPIIVIVAMMMLFVIVVVVMMVIMVVMMPVVVVVVMVVVMVMVMSMGVRRLTIDFGFTLGASAYVTHQLTSKSLIRSSSPLVTCN